MIAGGDGKARKTKPAKSANLLIPGEAFVQVQPSLIRVVGHASKALVLANLHGWLVRLAGDGDPDRWWDGACWIWNGHREMGLQVGLSESGHDKAARSLEADGLILHLTARAGRWRPRTFWTICYDELDVLGESRLGDTWQPVNRPQEPTWQDDESPSGALARDEVDAWFEAFWGRYPKQTGKAGAERAFRSVVKDVESAKAVMAGLALYVDGPWRWESEQFIPSATNFLRDGRYLDEDI